MSAPADGRGLWPEKIPQGTPSSIGGSPFAKFEQDGSKQPQLIDIATGDVVLSERVALTRMDCSQGEGGTVVLCASKQDEALAVDKAGEISWPGRRGGNPNDCHATVEADST
ncbi:hypothetical protein [Streptomyces sp. 6N106]|uniref:hypothetical protein n=1 Tax=Streptomyces sp. 6N106 TaxID=3457418 RepID=UPI003FD5A825